MFSSSNADKSASIFSHWKEYGGQQEVVVKSLPNPRADNYRIIKYREFDNSVVVKIKYLDCTNYEGIKILYFDNCKLKDLKRQKLIDPHFSENKDFISPTARFEPTRFGWRDAIMFATYRKQWKSKF